jgi:hypothetical protein
MRSGSKFANFRGGGSDDLVAGGLRPVIYASIVSAH